jgi:hypothetical protein
MTKVGKGGSGMALCRRRLRSCIFLICSEDDAREITESWISSVEPKQSPTGSAPALADLTSAFSSRTEP